MHSRRQLVVLLACLLTGCTSPSEPSGTVRIEVPATTFGRSPDGMVAVPYEVANTSRRAAYVDDCGDQLMVSLDRWEDESWAEYSPALCRSEVPLTPLVLAGGARRAGEHTISMPGRYRLRIGVWSDVLVRGERSARSEAFNVD